MKPWFDRHALIGAVGASATTVISGYSAVMGAIAATATAGYMVLRALLMYRKWKQGEVPIKRKGQGEDINQRKFDLDTTEKR